MTLPNPVCSCCDPPTCIIVADETTLANFTQVDGTWTKPGAEIETSDANALILYSTPHPESLSTGRVLFEYIDLPAAGATVRVLFAYLDSDNYLFQECEVITPGSTAGIDLVWRLGFRQGGADTILEECGTSNIGGGLTTEARVEFQAVCFNGSKISSTIGTGTPSGILIDRLIGMDSPLAEGGLTLGTYVGLQVIGNAGTVQFKDLHFGGINDSNCGICRGACSECSMEISGTPSSYSLHLIGIANDGCADCVATFDDVTFVLDGEYSSGDDYATRTCRFFYETGLMCGGNPMDLELTIGGSPVSATKIELLISDDGRVTFVRSSSACNETIVSTDCDNMSASQECDWTGVTATITPNMA